MEPFIDDDNPQEDEQAAERPDSGVVTGPAPYDAANDDDLEED